MHGNVRQKLNNVILSMTICTMEGHLLKPTWSPCPINDNILILHDDKEASKELLTTHTAFSSYGYVNTDREIWIFW